MLALERRNLILEKLQAEELLAMNGFYANLYNSQFEKVG